MLITDANLANWFQYHRPHGTQAERYEEIRKNAEIYAQILIRLTPSGPDQAAAIQKLRECVMLANASIACGEAAPEPLPASPADADTRKEIRVERV